MPSTIYCDRVRHDVQESPEFIASAIADLGAHGLLIVRPLRSSADLYLKVGAISSFSALVDSQPKTETRETRGLRVTTRGSGTVTQSALTPAAYRPSSGY